MKFDEFLNENPATKEKYDLLTDDEKRQLTEAIKSVERIVEVLFQMVKVCGKMVSAYPNKRIVYLALRSKKARVRKKNMHRIIKDLQRYCRENKTVS